MPRTRQRSPVRPSPLSSEIEVWYQKLEDAGFEDIEQPFKQGEPLLIWHSLEFAKPSALLRQEKRSRYQTQIDAFANSPEFPEILILMTRHGNNLFDSDEIENIWEFHRNGLSMRAIAYKMDCSKTCVLYLLRRMKEWMSLTV